MVIKAAPHIKDRSQGVSRTVAFLPLGYTDELANPESFTEHVKEAVQSTGDALALIFYWPSRKASPIGDLSPATQQADWDALQRFLGVIYGCAGREAAVLDRPLLDVLVLIDGLMDETLLRGIVSKIILLNEVGLNEIARFLETSSERQIVTRFSKDLRQAGDNSVPPTHPTTAVQEKQDHRHDVAALGGTFDHLHGGHKILLTMAVAITRRRLVIGLTTDVMLKSKSHAELLEPFETRTQHLQTFLSYLSTDIQYDIVALRDTYGPTATDEAISALIVSRESAAGGLAIDQVRATNGLAKLRTYVIDVISGNHGGSGTGVELDGNQKSLLVESSANPEQLKELKLGSTYIRQWLASRKDGSDSAGSHGHANPTRKDTEPAQQRKKQKTTETAITGKVDGPAPMRTAYEATSQRLRWTYSDKELEITRQELSDRAVEQCRKNWDTEASLLASEGSANVKVPKKFPSPEDERLLVIFYASSIRTIIAEGMLNNGRSLPSAIEGVAITFLKRFYLRTSVLEWHPKVIMPVCLFLAGKVCNHVFDIDNYVASFNKIKRDDILGVEYLVLQTLRFDVFVPRMQDALHGWFLKLQDANPSGMNRIEAAYLVAQSHLKRSRLSDAEFIYTPSQIAATCFRMADARLFQTALDKLLPLDTESQGGIETNSGQQSLRPLLARESLLEILQHIQNVIESAPLDGNSEMDKVKAADKLVKLAQDPAKNKSSALYRQQQRQQEAQQAEKRALRLRRAQQDIKNRDDFFGAPVGSGVTDSAGPAVGVKAESGNLALAGDGLKMVGMSLDSSDSE